MDVVAESERKSLSLSWGRQAKARSSRPGRAAAPSFGGGRGAAGPRLAPADASLACLPTTPTTATTKFARNCKSFTTRLPPRTDDQSKNDLWRGEWRAETVPQDHEVIPPPLAARVWAFASSTVCIFRGGETQTTRDPRLTPTSTQAVAGAEHGWGGIGGLGGPPPGLNSFGASGGRRETSGDLALPPLVVVPPAFVTFGGEM